jgi:hypothetical protein
MHLDLVLSIPVGGADSGKTRPVICPGTGATTGHQPRRRQHEGAPCFGVEARIPSAATTPQNARKASTSLTLICCTANGFVARDAASTGATSCAPPTRCSLRWAQDGFAERARRELGATGETVRKRTVETSDELAPQEAQITRLAREGRTNPEMRSLLGDVY